VLYEMLSGRRAFRGNTPAETLSAILKEDPPELSGSGRAVSPGLAGVVSRCLEKRRGDRFHSAHDLALALEAVSSGASRSSRLSVVRGRRLVWAGAVVALVTIAALWIGWPREPPGPPLRIKPITSYPGGEGEPALSPDGNQVAFVWRREQTQGIYIKLIDGGEPLLVSRGTEDSYAPAWSPDGRQIAFIRHVRDGDGQGRDAIFVVTALGGAERRLATSHAEMHGLSWSRDQKILAIVDRESTDEPDAIFLLSLESAQRRRLTRPPAGYIGDRQPRFSPDGRTLAFIRRVAPGKDDFYLVPVDGGEERRLTVGSSPKFGLDWTADGRSIVFSSSRLGGGGVFSLWRVPVSGGDPELLEFGAHGVWPTVARRGGRLAYVKGEEKSDIWRVGGPSAPEDNRSPTRLISSTWLDLMPRYSPDGRQIAFVSMRSGASEIWICDSDGSNPRQLTFLNESPGNGTPSWSPDGEHIAFSLWKEGSVDVYVVSLSGGPPRRLTTGPSMEVSSSWSQDGRWIYFHANQSGRFEVWKAPAEGGDALQVTTHGGTEAFESRDGRILYFTKSLPGGVPPGIWRLPRDGGKEVQVLDRGRPLSWALLEQGILYLDRSSEPPALELFQFATGQVSRVAVVEDVFDGGLSASPDGRSVLYTREVHEADIMLVQGFR
jgi:Tol biopolymer transport system component